MDKNNQPGEPRPDIVEKPHNEFKIRPEINFRYEELQFCKAIRNQTTNDLQLLFLVDEFYILLNQEEFFFYSQEVFQRSSESEERGESYMDVCNPQTCFYSKKEGKPIYMAINLLDGLFEMEEEK